MQARSWILAALAAALVFGLGPAVFLVTDAAWFDANGFGSVFRTLWLALDPRCCLLCVCGCRTFAAGCSCC